MSEDKTTCKKCKQEFDYNASFGKWCICENCVIPNPRCGHCGKTLIKVDEMYKGKKVYGRCPHCKARAYIGKHQYMSKKDLKNLFPHLNHKEVEKLYSMN